MRSTVMSGRKGGAMAEQTERKMQEEWLNRPAFGRVAAALFPFDRGSFGPVAEKERNRRDG